MTIAANPTPGSGLTFGIYAGSRTHYETPHPDDPTQIKAALAQLQQSGLPFLVRSYVLYGGNGQIIYETPVEAEQYAHDGRQLDLALCYHSPDGDLEDWTAFVQRMIGRFGPYLTKLQLTEEPNNPDAANGGDGSFPNVREAIIVGVLAAKQEAQRLGYAFQVGFNATPSFNPNDDFWPSIATLGSPAFLSVLDYVGLDFFPGVFQPLPRRADGSTMPLDEAVAGVLTHLRRVNLPTGNIPATIPIHITENGWPTGPTRSYEQQAAVLETTLRTIHSLCTTLNIASYTYHGLRDSDSSNGDLQYGLLRDDYTAKPAFERYRQLIAELSECS